MLKIGLTGGFGSGKSSVAKMFERLGATVIDADSISKELMGAGGEGARAIAREFGERALSKDGSVDRTALSEQAFSDGGNRAKLEAIMHPLIIARRRELVEEVRKTRGDGTVVVLEAALIFEAGTMAEFDLVILVTAPIDVRRSRLKAAGWDEATIESRIRSQWRDEQKIPRSRFVIDNGESLEQTERRVLEIWDEITR